MRAKHFIVFLFVLVASGGPVIAVAQASKAVADSRSEKPAASEGSAASLKAAIALINAYSGTGDHYERAYAMLTGMLKSNPEDGYAYAGMAELIYRMSSDRGAVAAAEVKQAADRAIQLAPRLAEPHVTLAKLYVDTKKLDLAEASATAAFQRDQKNPSVLFVQGRVSEANGYFGSAVDWYELRIDAQNNPDLKSNLYAWLADALMKQSPRNVDKALAAYRKAIELSPESPWKLINLSNFLVRNTALYDDAIAAAEKALTFGDYGAARYNLGMAMYGKWAAAFMAGSPIAGLNPETIQAKTGVDTATAVNCSRRKCASANIATAVEAFKQAGRR